MCGQVSYSAIVCRARTRPHPNADRLQLADCSGYQCIVGKDVADGTLGIVFPEGGILSEGFTKANELTKSLGGYLNDDRRVRALRLRGERSEGLWLELDCLRKWKPGYRGALAEGQPIEVWGSVDGPAEELCRKYVPPAVQRQLAQPKPKKTQHQLIPKHYDTPQLRNKSGWANAGFDPTARLIWTEKLHGTSARTGRVWVNLPLPWWKRALNVLPGVSLKPKREAKVVSGTRNCMLDASAKGEKGKEYRQYWHEVIGEQLTEGGMSDVVVYYEIVGYDENGEPIMPPHSVEGLSKEDLRAIPEGAVRDGKVHYDYNLLPDGFQNEAYIYRVTHRGQDLTWEEIKALADMIGVPTVPCLDDGDGLIDKTVIDFGSWLSREPSDTNMVAEGVCVRSESDDGKVSKWLKHKSFAFCCLEGIARNDADYWDAEEVA